MDMSRLGRPFLNEILTVHVLTDDEFKSVIEKLHVYNIDFVYDIDWKSMPPAVSRTIYVVRLDGGLYVTYEFANRSYAMSFVEFMQMDLGELLLTHFL